MTGRARFLPACRRQGRPTTEAGFDFGPRGAGVGIGVVGRLGFVEELFFAGGGVSGFFHLPMPVEDVAAVFRRELGQFGDDFGFAHGENVRAWV
jgi:hypothetical protein